MPHAYAQAILKLIEKGEKPNDAVAHVHTVLEKSGRIALLPHIARALERLAARDMQKSRSVLVVAREEDEKAARKESVAPDVELAVDESLIGGWRFEDKEKLTDASWKKHLLAMYGKVTST